MAFRLGRVPARYGRFLHWSGGRFKLLGGLAPFLVRGGQGSNLNQRGRHRELDRPACDRDRDGDHDEIVPAIVTRCLGKAECRKECASLEGFADDPRWP
jgi:hypothetical protein